jgi:hypothetical protein
MISKDNLVKWVHKRFAVRNLADKKYYDYLKGKRIIMVGPAPYLEGKKMGKEIDSYDIVVRINHGILLSKNNPEDYGSRTDVLYVNQKMRLHYQLDYPEEWLKEVKFLNSIFQQFPFQNPFPCFFCKNNIYPGDIIDFEFGEKNQGYFVHADCLPRNSSIKLNKILKETDKNLSMDEKLKKIYPNLNYREVYNEIIPHGKYNSFVYSGNKDDPESRTPPEFLLGGLLTYLDIANKINGTCSELRLTGFDFYSNLIQDQDHKDSNKEKMDIYMNNYLKIYSKDYAIIEHSGEQEAQCFPHFDQQQEQLKLFYLLTQLVAKGSHRFKLNIDDHLYKIVFAQKDTVKFLDN